MQDNKEWVNGKLQIKIIDSRQNYRICGGPFFINKNFKTVIAIIKPSMGPYKIVQFT